MRLKPPRGDAQIGKDVPRSSEGADTGGAMVEEGTGGRTTTDDPRKSASALIAAMWAERELTPPPPVLQAPSEPSTSRPAPTPRPRRGRQALLAVVIVAVGGTGAYVVAQGDPRPSKAAFVAQAEGICAGGPSIPTPSSYAELKDAAATVATTSAAQLRRLDKLGLPGLLDRGRAAGVLDAMRATRTAAGTVEAAATSSNDTATVAAAHTLRARSDQAAAKAAAYGMARCAGDLQRNADTLVGGAGRVVKAGFLFNANALCRTATTAVAAVPPAGKDGADIARFVGEAFGPLEQLAFGLKALPVPPGDEATVADILTTVDQANGTGRAMAHAAVAADPNLLPTVRQQFVDLGKAAGAKLSAYGVGPC